MRIKLDGEWHSIHDNEVGDIGYLFRNGRQIEAAYADILPGDLVKAGKRPIINGISEYMSVQAVEQ